MSAETTVRGTRELVPFNALGRRVGPVKADLTRVANEVIDSGYYVLGPNVAAFESEFADYLSVNHCIGVANGTDALEVALKATGVGAGDYVALAANAAMYGTTAVLAAGAIPVYVDTDPALATLSAERLKSQMEAGPPIRAVIVTHLYGQLADVDAIMKIARSFDAKVVEDCAQAHGARTLDGRIAGSIGDAGAFSFYPTKNLGALGDGGAVTSNCADVMERAKSLRQYGWSGKYNNGLSGGRNSRLDEIQAAMLRVMLPLLDGWNARRRAIAGRMSSGITNPRIEVPSIGLGHAGHLYVVRTVERDALRQHLADNAIQAEIHYPTPDHRQALFGARFADVALPVTERDAGTVLSLPCFPELQDEEVERIIDTCNRF